MTKNGGKIVAVMQPYFFPYLGYFSLIKHVDRFILFDPVQHIRHGWIDRNRVLKQGGGWIYIRAPLQPHSHHARIHEIQVDNAQPWKQKLLSQLGLYKRRAPFFWKVRKLVEEALAPQNESLVAVNKAALEAVCAYLGMPRSFEVLTEMAIEIEPPHAPDEWALNVCRALGGVAEYWNPPGGQSFFDKSKYDCAGIELRFQKARITPYDQGEKAFEPGLSIIDVLMFNSPEAVHRMLDDYELS